MDAVQAEGILENFTGPGLGWIGGIIFTVIAVSTVLLLRNMNMRIKRLPETFEESTEDAPNTDPLKHLPPKGDAAIDDAAVDEGPVDGPTGDLEK